MDSHHTTQQRIDGPVRWVLLALAIGLVSLLGIARGLDPDPRGHGTHTQLGLAPCGFARVTGHPCPTCGMTTSFAWFTRGHWKQAWRANPAGCLIALAIVPVSAWLVVCVLLKKPAGFRSIDGPLLVLFAMAVCGSLASWLVRLLGVPTSPAFPGLPPGFGTG